MKISKYILMCLGAVLVLGGCQSPHQKQENPASSVVLPRSVMVIPSLGQREAAGLTGIPPIAVGDWVAHRNNMVLGGKPDPIPRSLYAERTMWDVQRTNSGRPNGHFRYETRTRSLAGP
jgi:hypothetical protein